MARGCCFFVGCDPVFAEGNEVNIQMEEYERLNIDSTVDESEEESAKDIKYLLDNFRLNGATTGLIIDTDGTENQYFILDENFKRMYFSERLKKLKKAVDKITLDEFALRDPFVLESLITDNYGNCICENMECTEPIDTFIRYAECGRKYYIGKTVVLLD